MMRLASDSLAAAGDNPWTFLAALAAAVASVITPLGQ